MLVESLLPLVYSYIFENLYFSFGICIIFLYIIYYYKLSYYIYIQNKNFTVGKRNIGKTLPAYPNGWFVILNSSQLSVGETKYINTHGENLCVYRGNNGKAYVIEAYCPHLGANLGIDGRVINDSCIQCPFHSWTFDGETGNCVIGKENKIKEAIEYEYNFDNQTKKYEFKEKCTSSIKLKKFISKEYCGYIYVWFHSEYLEPPYQPLDLTEFYKRLNPRGYSLNKVAAHMSDIAENGGDLLHFLYVHTDLVPFIAKGSWDALWVRADDPKLKEKISLSNTKYHKYRMDLVDKFINEENKKYIGVIHLCLSARVLNIPLNDVFAVTAFQVGPGLVYLFMQGAFFETLLFQYIQSQEKFYHHLYHVAYSNYFLPYWFSAFLLRGEVRQVLNDGLIWDNKRFAFKAFFNKTANVADECLIQWRQWYCQFYDGCTEKNNSLDW